METLDIKTKQTLVRKTIWLCWFALIGCFIIKLFGGNYFEIIANNETFVNLCSWMEKHYISTIIMYGLYCLSLVIITSTISINNIFKKKNLILIPLIILMCMLKGINAMIGYFVELAFIIIVPLIIAKEKRTKIFIRFIYSYLLVNGFQLLSLFIRNIDAHLLNTNFCIGLLFQIDYYIMLILYYLYSVKLRGDENMGQWSIFWFGNDIAMDKGYAKFIKAMSLIGIVLTFPISVPYMLWKKHKRNKVK